MTREPARPGLYVAALASLAAALVALVVRTAEPFEHGAWLVAYLVLVGFLAQLLLGRGQAALLSSGDLPAPSRTKRLAQTVLWNLGVVAVPLGVLAETRLAVVVGSLSLLAALASSSMTVRPIILSAAARRSRLASAYVALLLIMTASVVVGSALAWDIPWT
jgi:hypothetical protein